MSNYSIEIYSIKDNEACYRENNNGEEKKILFDYAMKYPTLFSKGVITIAPDSFTNWSNGEQKKLDVFEYTAVLKRVIHFLNKEFSNCYIFVEGVK